MVNNKDKNKDHHNKGGSGRHVPGQDDTPEPKSSGEESGGNGDSKPKNPLEEALISMPINEYETLQNDVEATKMRANEYFDGWQRERADFANYKKRIERDQAQLTQNITGSIIKKYLPIVDDLERALKTRPNVGEGGGWSAGIDLIYRKLLGILESEGVTRIGAEDEEFDPNRHEAISHEDSPDHESGHVIEVVQTGYMLGDRVLRPAIVRVAR